MPLQRPLRSAAALAACAICVAALMAACGHAEPPPAAAARVLGLPIYPGARAQSHTGSSSQFAAFETADSVGAVYAWYAARLPADTPRAYVKEKREATFALIDTRWRRTIHIGSDGAATQIVLTRVAARGAGTTGR